LEYQGGKTYAGLRYSISSHLSYDIHAYAATPALALCLARVLYEIAEQEKGGK
jgi:hypothetical protein